MFVSPTWYVPALNTEYSAQIQAIFDNKTKPDGVQMIKAHVPKQSNFIGCGEMGIGNKRFNGALCRQAAHRKRWRSVFIQRAFSEYLSLPLPYYWLSNPCRKVSCE